MGEIRGPRRATGDVAACHRLLQSDCKMLARIGAKVVSLRSQAQPGDTVRQRAFRPANEDVSDWKPAS